MISTSFHVIVMTDMRIFTLRRMFPFLELSFQGLNPQQMYVLRLDICPSDDKRFKYSERDNRWNASAATNLVVSQPVGIYMHPEGPFLGRQLKNPIKFHKVKLTNDHTRTKFNGHVSISKLCICHHPIVVS